MIIVPFGTRMIGHGLLCIVGLEPVSAYGFRWWMPQQGLICVSRVCGGEYDVAAFLERLREPWGFDVCFGNHNCGLFTGRVHAVERTTFAFRPDWDRGRWCNADRVWLTGTYEPREGVYELYEGYRRRLLDRLTVPSPAGLVLS